MLSNEQLNDGRTPAESSTQGDQLQAGQPTRNQAPDQGAGVNSTGSQVHQGLPRDAEHDQVGINPDRSAGPGGEALEDSPDPNDSTPALIAEVTQELYEKIFRRLIKYSSDLRSHDQLEPVSLSPVQLVDDLYERQDIRSSSFSTYRSALLWIFSSRLEENPAYQAGLDRIHERSKMASGGEPPQKGRTRRKKVIPESDFHLLIDELTGLSSRSKWSYRTMYWLHAGLATGLRPVEWENAHWANDDHDRLDVKNAKRKVSPAAFLRKSAIKPLTGIPEERQIPVQPADRFYIEQHMRLIDEAAAEGVPLAEYYQQCRRALWRACRKLWNGRKVYSLYTMRGQYSANSRAAVGPAATSVLMGHSREDTPSAAHYGKANQAHRGQVDKAGSARGQTDNLQSIPAESPSSTDAAIPRS